MDRLTVWLADIRPLADRESEAMALLTTERREEAARHIPQQDRLHCATAGLLLRSVLGVTSDDMLCRTEFGKRALKGGGPCFNLSHGGNYAALAVFDSPVGIDIEPVGGKIPIRIPKRYLQPDELAWLEEEQTPERFAQLWTRLESALKADGRGFGMADRNFSVLDGGTLWHIETFPWDGHVISCTAGKTFEIEVRQLSIKELLI